MNDYRELIGDIDDLLIAHPSEILSKRYLKSAADAIEQLVRERDAARKERDAAVADIKKNWMCATCNKRIVGKEWLYCLHLLPVEAEDGSRTCLNYKWRGVRE